MKNIQFFRFFLSFAVQRIFFKLFQMQTEQMFNELICRFYYPEMKKRVFLCGALSAGRCSGFYILIFFLQCQKFFTSANEILFLWSGRFFCFKVFCE